MEIIDSIAVVVGYIAIGVISFFATAYIGLFLWLWLSRSIVTYIAILKVDKIHQDSGMVKPEFKKKKLWKARLLFFMLREIDFHRDETRNWKYLTVYYKGLGVSYKIHGYKKK